MICSAGAAAELANVDCIFHGHHSMDLIGALQVGATIRSATMQEIVFTTPGILPEEAWSPLAVLVKTPQLLEVKVIIARRFCLCLCLSLSVSLILIVPLPLSSNQDGVVKIPTAPGLGIEVDEEAVERYRVPDGGATVRR